MALSIVKVGISTTPVSKTPEPIDMKLRMSNYVGDLTLTSPSTGAIDLCGWSGRMREISLFVTLSLFVTFFFFSLLHLACRSPQLTDFDDLCVKMRGSGHGSHFGGVDDNTKCLRVDIPQKPQFLGRNRHFKPYFRKLKSQYLRRYKLDRRKIFNIASGRQVDFVGGLKIKSNQIQDSGGRHFENRKMPITQPLFQISSPSLVS